MDTDTLEKMINELEQNSERLRALYDQYFMGIERIEPSVLKKNVDRQIYVLRREQIRNTGLRFKLNTIISRLNTYQQYWMRTCREIENGTYKRDLRRAAKRFGEEAVANSTGKRKGKLLTDEERAEQQARAEQARPVQHSSHDDEFDVDVDMDEMPAGSVRPPQSEFDEIPLEDDFELGAPRKKTVGPVVLKNLRWSLDDLDNVDDFGPPPAKLDAPLQPEPAIRRPEPPAAIRRPQPVEPPAQRRWTLDDLDNVDDFGPPPPPKLEPKPATVATAAPAVPQVPVFGRSFQALAPRAASPPAVPAPAVPAPAVPTPQRAAPTPAAAPQRAAPTPAIPPQRAAVAPVRQAPIRPPDQVIAPPPPPRQAPAIVQRPPPAAVATPPARPAPAAPIQRAVVSEQRAAPSASAEASLSDARVRQIFDKYVQVKRDCKESTSGITTDTLASSLRDSAKKLAAKHTGKQVDFDVIIKDGKAVLKPVIKG